MAEPGPQPQNIPALNSPPPPADPVEPQASQQPAHQVAHLNWSHFKPEFSGSLMRMQKPICSALMTG